MFNGFKQLESEDAAVAVGRLAGGSVGRVSGTAVKVGNGVGLAVSVGGRGVAVGMASCVAATIVHAAETAVFCTSTGAMVGVPCAPQAVRKTANINKIGNIRLSIICFSIFE